MQSDEEVDNTFVLTLNKELQAAANQFSIKARNE